MYFVYILHSKIANKFYTGKTNDLDRRLNEHNAGKSYYSNRYKPWEIIYVEKFAYEIEAVTREKYLKSAAGRRWIKKRVQLQ